MRKNASESNIALLITQGKNNSEIARQLKVDRKRVASVRGLINPSTPPTLDSMTLDKIRAVARLELSQEETLNEFSDQLGEYTKNYKSAMLLGDQEAAAKWAVLRVKLLESMIKISGLDKRCELPPPDPQDALYNMSDEEVERRAREILAKRQ
jgi:hypothetical protein